MWNNAHQLGVDVEAEIGFVGANAASNNEEVKSIYTSVEDAKKFVEETNVDSLAVSIGTSHGLYKGTPKLNFERLEELDEGHIILDGEDITNVPAEKRHINTVFQSYALFPHMTYF